MSRSWADPPQAGVSALLPPTPLASASHVVPLKAHVPKVQLGARVYAGSVAHHGELEVFSSFTLKGRANTR